MAMSFLPGELWVTHLTPPGFSFLVYTIRHGLEGLLQTCSTLIVSINRFFVAAVSNLLLARLFPTNLRGHLAGMLLPSLSLCNL